MQVMVVPNTSMEGLARRLAFQIGGTGVHTCSGYTSQHYSDSEPALFVGRTQCPTVVCLSQSAPAEDLRPLPRLARGLAAPSRRRPNEEAKDRRFAEISAAVGAGVPLVLAVAAGLVPGVAELSFMGALRCDSAQIGKLRRQVCDELYADGVSRFVEEDFPKMVEPS